MPQRFFVAGDVARDGLVIAGPAARHIARSLRMRSGDHVVVVDELGQEHGVRLRTVRADRVDGEVTWSRAATGEPRLRITVVQALPRERMEDCIDLLVEVGAAAVRPVITERVVSRPGPDRAASRLTRWQAVATEAAQLAGRGVVPPIHPPVPLAQALGEIESGSRVVACTFDGRHPLATIDVDVSVPLALCIGPEGGFADTDLEALRGAGAETVHLGARVLRTRYAAAMACALLLAHAGDLATPVVDAPTT